MESLIKKIIKKLFPELGTGLHVPKFAQVVRVAEPPADGDVSTEFSPYYAVDIQLLTDKGQIDTDKPVYPAVPLLVPSGSDNQGQYGFPKIGTWVILEFAYGSPEHPVIVGILPHRRTLPAVPVGDLLLQLNKKSFFRTTTDFTELQAPTVVIGNGEINLLAEVRRLASILENHTHSGIEAGGSNTQKPIQAAEIADVKNKVNSITK